MADQMLRVVPPYNGVDLTSSPELIRPGFGQTCRNFLPGRAGLLLPRGPIDARGSVSFKVDGAGTVGAWPDYAGATVLFNDFFAGPAKMGEYVSPAGGAPVVVNRSGAGLTDPHTLYPTYGLLVDTAGATRFYGYWYNGATSKLVEWNGGTTVKHVTNGPTNCQYCLTHESRLWCLDTDGHIYYTNGDPATALAADDPNVWKDPVTGLTNKINLSAGNVTNAVSTPSGLYIFTTRETYILRGYGPTTFQLKKLMDVGSPFLQDNGASYVYGLGATAAGNTVYFYNGSGIAAFDGNYTVISGPISAVLKAQAPSGYVQVVVLEDQWLSVLTMTDWFMYHIPTGSWSTMTSTAFTSSSDIPSMVRRHPRWGTGIAIDVGRNATNGFAASMFYVFRPEWVGLDPTLNIGYDYTTDLYDMVAESGVFRLGEPERKAAIRRMYSSGKIKTTVDGTSQVLLQLIDQDLVAGGSLALTGTTAGRMQHVAGDAFFEAETVYARWSYVPTSAEWVSASELHEANLLYSPAQQR